MRSILGHSSVTLRAGSKAVPACEEFLFTLEETSGQRLLCAIVCTHTARGKSAGSGSHAVSMKFSKDEEGCYKDNYPCGCKNLWIFRNLHLTAPILNPASHQFSAGFSTLGHATTLIPKEQL